jgi:O-antigen ligase
VRRMAGVVGGHDSLADVCVLMFPLVLFRFYRARTMTRRLLYVTTLGLAVFALIATANRGGLIGLAFCLAYLTVLTLREFNVVRYGVIGICLLVLMPAFDYYISTFRGGDSMFRRVMETKIESNLVPDTRVEVWRIAWEAYTQHIFVGHGLYFDYRVIPQPHNGFLWALITTGLLGTIPFVWILLKLVWATGRRLRGNMERGDFASGLLTVFHVQIVTFILVQLRTDYQRSPTYLYLVWILFGLALVAMRILDAERRAARAQA